MGHRLASGGAGTAVIEDLDGSPTPPNRRAHVRIVSAVLVLAALVGWAAASEPSFQGPFATPRPSMAPIARFTPAPTDRIERAAFFSQQRGCIQPGAMWGTTVFVNGRSVNFEVRITVGAWSCALPSEIPVRPGFFSR